jgi:hypothetical protein
MKLASSDASGGSRGFLWFGDANLGRLQIRIAPLLVEAIRFLDLAQAMRRLHEALLHFRIFPSMDSTPLTTGLWHLLRCHPYQRRDDSCARDECAS